MQEIRVFSGGWGFEKESKPPFPEGGIEQSENNHPPFFLGGGGVAKQKTIILWGVREEQNNVFSEREFAQTEGAAGNRGTAKAAGGGLTGNEAAGLGRKLPPPPLPSRAWWSPPGGVERK